MKFPVSLYGLNFRLVEEGDAQFIVDLRTDKKLARYLSYTNNSVENQAEWIRNYKLREAKGKEYYILFEDEAQTPLGVARLYNIKDNTFTGGSWLIRPGCDELVALRSDLFVLMFSFDELKMEQCFIDIRKENTKLVRYHKMFFTQINEDEDNIYLVMDKEACIRKRKFLTSVLNIDPSK